MSGVPDDDNDALKAVFPQMPPVESDVEAQRQFHRVGALLFGGAPEPVMLGRWEVGELIDAGGMGLVYRAYDPRLRRDVAIKALQLGLGADVERRRQRMLREAQAMARVHHPNVIDVYDVEVSDAQIFLVMELVVGMTLSAWLQVGERRWSEILDVYLAAGEGLAASHAVDVVHRDFKPDNVLVDARGQVKVIDFGLARAPETRRSETFRADSPLGQALTADGVVVGTLNYMAPEQLRGELVETSALSDQYSFCRALFESLYQSRPFHGNSVEALLAAMEAEELDFGSPPRHVPRRLRGILRRGLAVKPGRRFPTMLVLLAELRAAQKPRWGLFLGGALLAAFSVGLGPTLYDEQTDEQCSIVAQRHQIWGEERMAEVQEAVLRLPISRLPEAWARINQRMSAHVEAWAQRGASECALGARTGPVAACLIDHGVRLAALSEALTRATPDLVTNIDVMLIDMDEQLQRCQLAPSGGAAARAAGPSSLHLRGRFARAWVEELSGRLVVARAEALAALDEALTLGDRALVAEAELRVGRVLGRMQDAAAYKHLEAARQIGMETGELMTTVDAGIFLVKFAADVLEDPILAQRSGDLLEAMLVQLGEPTSRRAQLLDARGMLAQVLEQNAEAAALHGQAWASLRGILDEASPEMLRIELNRVNALSRVAVPKAGETGAAELYAELLARAEAALGPSHSLTGIIRFNTARYLFGAGKREAADAEGRKALRVIQTVFGAESRTAATIELLLGRIAEEREQFAQAETFAGQAMAHFDAVERQEGRVYSAALGAVDLSAHLARHRGEQTMAAALFDRGAAMAARSGLGAPMQALEIASNAASVRLEAQLWPEALKQLQGLMAQIELHGLQQTFVGIQIRGNLGIARLGVGDPSAAVVDLEAALRDVVSLADTIPDLAPLEPILRAKLEEARSRLRHRR